MLLLLALLISKDTIITTLAPKAPAATPAPVTLRIVNPSAAPLKNIVLEWSLQSNGVITKKGKTSILILPPNKPTLLRLPLRLPDDTAGESFLQLRYRSASPPIHSSTTHSSTHSPAGHLTSPPGPLLSEQQLLIRPYQPRLNILPAGEITLTDENDIFTVHSPSIRISFNRQTGWLVHYEIKGVDLLDDTLGLRPNFWWPGYNDSANFYAAQSALHRDSNVNYATSIDSGWQAATREPHLQLFSNTTSPQQIIIRTEYTLPATTSLLHLSYTINAGGEMLITQQVEPDTSQPPSRPWPMPCFGMQWILPPGYDSITEYGPLNPNVAQGPGAASNPGWIGLRHEQPLTPLAADPQARATATRTGVRWWTITDKKGNGLLFIADTPLLNESALHSFDSDLISPPNHPTSRPQAQISIDRPSPAMPASQPQWPTLLPMGNYRYTYKVKPLVSN